MAIKILKKAIKTWGVPLQLIKTCEECGELIQAVSKVGLGKWPTERLTEEIADVEIMIAQLKIIYGISNSEITKHKEAKFKKLEERLKNAK